ncbi:MAG TPA: MBOAT family protein [Stellaceae bacterium]|nr:MBOAT family protein [Stellaceae bacterium]
MLFNSYEFIFLFLPVTAALYFLIGRRSQDLAALWLALASLFFYGYWNPAYLPLLLVSIAANFGVGRLIAASDAPAPRRALLIAGLVFDLTLLGYYKYAGFLVEAANDALGLALPVPEIYLPLGISFFTFTQIAFLVDVYQRKASEYRAVHYLLFVSFFPHLIAGPILHHKEIMPQFAQARTYRPSASNFAVGLSIFFIGLAKKTAIADGFSPFVAHVFEGARQGATPGFAEAWSGALAYTLQLYFDFSGYSDMAIGLARILGVKMPLNFLSPYKAADIVDFWRRWHMTLSRFLRDYLYIPLGGNRRGKPRRYLNLMITMALGGLWHGAGWTFAAWGTLHGFYLVANHAWRAAAGRLGLRARSTLWSRGLARLVTFLAVVVGWVVFRADTLASAIRVLVGMTGAAGLAARLTPVHWNELYPRLAVCLLIVWLAPNTQQIMARYTPSLPIDPALLRARVPGFVVRWRQSLPWAYASAAVACVGILWLGHVTEFLYFRF